MPVQLFRIAAIEAKKDRLNGVVVLRQPSLFYALLLAALVVVVAVVALLVYGSSARRQNAVGHIVPTMGVVKLYPRLGGIVDALNVVEGTEVKAGAVLAVISNRRELSDATDTDAQLVNQLRTSIVDTENKILEEQNLAALELERLHQSLIATRADSARLQTQLKTEQERLALAEARKSDFERLQVKGFVSETQYKDQVQLWLDGKLRVDASQRTLSNQQAQMFDLQAQIEQLPGKQALRSADLRNQLSELNQRRIEIESRREFAVVAPVAGRVTAIQAKIGQVVSAQLPLLTIIPKDSKFEAELFVPSRAIGFIGTGQTVYLRYQAFPYQRYGLYEGSVKQVASSIQTAQETLAAVPLPNEPVYRVVVALNAQDVQAYGKRFSLQAGMLLEADIVLDRRPIWQWLLEPVLSLRGRI